jgi:ubiquinone/menaquinone biosynthesis C-methylase UbiE
MISTYKPTSEYRKVVQANVLMYAKYAKWHDTTESCAVSPQCQAMLNEDLESIVSMLSSTVGGDINALDACGGSGNVALKLLKRGARVTLCDVSSEMIKIFESKCQDEGFVSKSVNADIGSFLSSTDERFDLITFSSALHHLYDYTAILRLASNRLNPGGMIYTVFDGTRHGFVENSILMIDYLTFKSLNHLSDLPGTFLRKLRRMKAGYLRESAPKGGLQLTPENIGILADYHDYSGIDDFALVQEMRRHGFEVVWHERYPETRYSFFRFILTLLKRPTSFKLLLRWKS